MAATHRRVRAHAHCPFCRKPLAGGTGTCTREAIEVPRVRVIVTGHVYRERRCAAYRRRCLPGPGLAVVGQGRLGVGLLSLIAWPREERRLPVAAVQHYLATLFDTWRLQRRDALAECRALMVTPHV